MPANTDARCTEPRGSKTSVRGAQNAPAPSNRYASVVPRDGTNRDDPDSAVSSLALTGYDPTSGLAMGAGDVPLAVGSRGGQERAFGEESWTWLLLGPLSR